MAKNDPKAYSVRVFFLALLAVGVVGSLLIVAGALALGWDLVRRWVQYKTLLAQLGVPDDWREYEYRLRVMDARVRELAEAEDRRRRFNQALED